MKHLDLFSGIGGFALAVDRVWHEEKNEHIFCDNDDFCQAVLKKHWPQAKIYGDIRTLTHSTFRDDNGNAREVSGANEQQAKERPQGRIPKSRGSDCFLLTGGFPCQPFSQAGRRKGTADDRYLWPPMLECIALYRPRWVIAENVAGLVTWNDGMVLEQVCTDLEKEGYEVQAFIIPAVAVNAPHRRDRIWIVAHSINKGSADGDAADTESGGEWSGQRKGNNSRESEEEAGNDNRNDWQSGCEICEYCKRGEVCIERRKRDVAYSERTRREESEHQRNAENKKKTGAGLDNRFERQSWNQNWLEVATRLCGVFNGLSEELDEDRQEMSDGIYSKHAPLASKISRQDLPHLWHLFQSQKVQWKIGRFDTLQQQDYLFTVLWQLTGFSKGQDYPPFESAEVQEAFVRNVWRNGEAGCPPQGWRYNKQYAEEHKDALSSMSHEVALVAKEVWETYLKDRNPRLKALGNAIVAQVAEEIMRAIKML